MGPGCERNFPEAVSSALIYFLQKDRIVIPPTPVQVDTFISVCALGTGLISIGTGVELLWGLESTWGPGFSEFSALWMAALLASSLEVWLSSQGRWSSRPAALGAPNTTILGVHGTFDSQDCKGAWQPPHLMSCYTDDFRSFCHIPTEHVIGLHASRDSSLPPICFLLGSSTLCGAWKNASHYLSELCR